MVGEGGGVPDPCSMAALAGEYQLRATAGLSVCTVVAMEAGRRRGDQASHEAVGPAKRRRWGDGQCVNQAGRASTSGPRQPELKVATWCGEEDRRR
jgi:hypothetical protein